MKDLRAVPTRLADMFFRSTRAAVRTHVATRASQRGRQHRVATGSSIAVLLASVALLGACQNAGGTKAPNVERGEQAMKSAPIVEAEPAALVSTNALQTAELMVEGTSCASCAVTIRRHLHQLAGIGDIREGSSKQHLLVEFDPQLVTTEQLVKAVSDAGYEAEVWVHGPGATSVREQDG